MSFDTAAGTRGARQPSGFAARWSNKLVAGRVRKGGAVHPDQVQIEVEGREVAVTAEQLHGAERAEAWQQITTAAPRFTRYQEKTDRELPIIRLVPR